MSLSIPNTSRGQRAAPPTTSLAAVLASPVRAVIAMVAALVLVATAGVATAGATVSQPSTPTSTTENVVPYVLRNDDGSLVGPGGNVDCAYVGTFEWASDRTDYDPADPGENFTVLIKDGVGAVVASAEVTYRSDAKVLDFEATVPVEAVIVKGGNDANIYDYRPAGVLADTGLGAPPNASGGASDLSNVTFCTNPVPPPESSWCSPGYWRQPQHLDSWSATGISPDAAYISCFDVTSLSRKASNRNPTLLQVLQAPQTYGGAAFNNVGDLLSAAHPDVAWMPGDDRTEDSCPLS